MALFLQSSKKLEVGKVYKGFYGPIGKNAYLPNQPYLVLEEATAHQWIECMVSFGHDRNWTEALSRLAPYFYEISTD